MFFYHKRNKSFNTLSTLISKVTSLKTERTHKLKIKDFHKT